METKKISNGGVTTEEAGDQQADSSVTTGVDETSVEGQASEQTQNVEQDRPQKNVDSEWMRKYNNLRTEFDQVQQKIPDIIQQSVEKAIGGSKQEKQYGVDDIAQIRAYAEENPEYSAWAQSEIDRINREEAAKIVRKELDARENEIRNNQMRQAAESEVLTDTKYSDAFVTMPNGQKTWNPESKLAQLIGQYMNDDRIKGQPDGLLIAAKLARADIIDAKADEINSLKRQNVNLQKQTLSEGGGVNVQPKTGLNIATERLRQTGSDTDAKAALKEFLKKRKG